MGQFIGFSCWGFCESNAFGMSFNIALFIHKICKCCWFISKVIKVSIHGMYTRIKPKKKKKCKLLMFNILRNWRKIKEECEPKSFEEGVLLWPPTPNCPSKRRSLWLSNKEYEFQEMISIYYVCILFLTPTIRPHM